jgi:valyl-tRNA synthetase
MEIGYKVPLEVRVADAALRARLMTHARAIDDLANAQISSSTDRPAGVATAVVRGVELTIPLEGVVDFREEVVRLNKVLAKVEKDASDLERRLGNADFVAKAPVEIVDDMRAKLASAHARRTALSASRDRLAAAIR